MPTISLLPTISKIFERIIHNQMYDHFNNNNLLAEQQYGFRRLHSTEYAAVNLIDHFLYIDLSKAFDTLSFDILIYKLRYYGFSGIELKLLISYVKNRKQYIKHMNLISLRYRLESPKNQSLDQFCFVFISMISSWRVIN